MCAGELRYRQLTWPMSTVAMLLVLVLSLGVGIQRAFAHGDSVLTVSPEVVTVGESFTVKAERFEAGEKFRISLLGLSYEVILGDVIVGDDEDFHEDFVVPNDTPPGVYQVEAVSEEGETLVAELTVLASTTSTTSSADSALPSNENVQLKRTRTPGEWFTIVALILTSIGLGVVLIRGRKTPDIDS